MEKYTDQEFFYKQTPVNYDGIAKFTSIKGNTLGWNQQIPIPTRQSGTLNGIAVINNGDGSLTLNGTPSNMNINWWIWGDYATNVSILSLKASHKYFVKDCNLYRETGGSLLVQNIGASPVIWSPSDDCELGGVRAANGDTSKTYTNVKVYPMIIDLTQMGLDSLTVDEFTSLFPLSYYDYNQGTLIPFSGNGIKTTGMNLAQNDNATNQNRTSFAYTSETLQNVSATKSAGGGLFYFKLKARLKANTVYKLSVGAVNIASATHSVNFYIYSDSLWGNAIYSNKQVAQNSSHSFSFTEDYENAVIGFFVSGNAGIGVEVNDIMLTFEDTDTSVFEPYTETTTSLPISTYFPTGMKRAGNVYDELTESKAITRVGSRAYQSGDENNANYVTDGTTTYYPLATETETDAEDIFCKFYGNGTEQLLPVNESTPVTSYLIADIEYYDSTEGDSLYRRFWLINGDGERWDLTDKEFRSFLNNPTGLGFRKTIEITRYGEKANKNNEVYDFPQPSGELLFYDTYNSTRYDKYNKFIRFLMSQPITLYYMIPVSYISGIANIFTLNCDVTEVQKTESKTDHILTSSIVFNGLGFYEGDEISINGTTDTYTLTNDGDFPVGFEITIEGSNMETPYITLSQDGELYGEAKFEGSEGTGYGGISFSHVYLNSNDGEQNLELKDQRSAILPNPLNYQDLSISNGAIYVTFIKLAKGVSELSIGMESGSISSVNIKYSPKYRSV